MPPRLNLLAGSRTLPIRPRPIIERWRPSTIQHRSFADSTKDLPVSPNEKGPNTDQLPHVSEEAAATGKIMGEGGPDLNQGTPIEEVVEGDKKAQEHLPKVMKDALKKPSGTRSFSTSAFQRQDTSLSGMESESSVDPSIIESGTSVLSNPATTETAKPGVKFGLPALPLPSELNRHHRYDPLIEQFTGVIMRHGKKGVAQRVITLVPTL
jgi:small subunit ribosomal protein S7